MDYPHKEFDRIWELRGLGRIEEALELLEKVHSDCKPDSNLVLGRVYHIRMQFESDMDYYEEALRYSTESVNHYRKSGNMDRIAHAIRHQADLLQYLDRNDGALPLYEEAISIYLSSSVTEDGDYANALRGLAILKEKLNETEFALNAWNRIESIYDKYGIAEGVAEAEAKIEFLKKKIKNVQK